MDVFPMSLCTLFAKSSVYDEMWMLRVANARLELESFILELPEVIGISNLVLDDESCHGPPAAFGIDRDGLEPAALHHEELWLNERHFCADLLPIEQVLHLLGRQVDEDAVVRLHGLYQQVGQQRLPMIEHAPAIQLHFAFHPVWVDQVKRAEQPVKEGSYP